MKYAAAMILIALAACTSAYDGPPTIGVGGVWNQTDSMTPGGHSGSTGGHAGGRGASGNGAGAASGGMGRR